MANIVRQEDLRRWNVEQPIFPPDPKRSYKYDPSLNAKVCLYKGDITRIRIDAIVNAANYKLQKGGGICGAIHKAAGDQLEQECKAMYPQGCKPGEAMVTGGYKLPAQSVIHAVGPKVKNTSAGPTEQDKAVLKSAYKNTFNQLLMYGMRSVALCSISTGIYGFPLGRATHTALKVTRETLETYKDQIDLVVFCVFDDDSYQTYYELMSTYYFPLSPTSSQASTSQQVFGASSSYLNQSGAPSRSGPSATSGALVPMSGSSQGNYGYVDEEVEEVVTRRTLYLRPKK